MRRFTVKFLAIMLFSGLTASCDSPFAPLPDGRPEEFEFAIEGFGFLPSTWSVRGDTLLVVRRPVNYPVELSDTTWSIPTVEQWRAFWSAAEKCGIRRWQRQYHYEGIIEGGSWDLKLRNGSFELRSQGYNAYPDHLGNERKAAPTSAFQHFVDALRALSGMAVPLS